MSWSQSLLAVSPDFACEASFQQAKETINEHSGEVAKLHHSIGQTSTQPSNIPRSFHIIFSFPNKDKRCPFSTTQISHRRLNTYSIRAMADTATKYPRILIEYCTQCHWMLRAAWCEFPISICGFQMKFVPWSLDGLALFPAPQYQNVSTSVKAFLPRCVLRYQLMSSMKTLSRFEL